MHGASQNEEALEARRREARRGAARRGMARRGERARCLLKNMLQEVFLGDVALVPLG